MRIFNMYAHGPTTSWYIGSPMLDIGSSYIVNSSIGSSGHSTDPKHMKAREHMVKFEFRISPRSFRWRLTCVSSVRQSLPACSSANKAIRHVRTWNDVCAPRSWRTPVARQQTPTSEDGIHQSTTQYSVTIHTL